MNNNDITYKMPDQIVVKTRLYSSEQFAGSYRGRRFYDIFLEEIAGRELTANGVVLKWTEIIQRPEITDKHQKLELASIDRHFDLVIKTIIDDEPFRNLCIDEMAQTREQARKGIEQY